MKTTIIDTLHNKVRNTWSMVCLALGLLVAVPLMSSCSDEPDQENFYTFTGEMMSDYLKSRPQFSEFTKIMERADLMDLLATYGHYTCFAPTNDAINVYLAERGLQSVDQLSDVDCDTIARTHLLENMYTTFDMTRTKGITLMNFLRRYISPSVDVDADGNAVVLLDGLARIDYYNQNDSVENGIMQPIDRVIGNSSSLLTDVVREEPNVSIFYNALLNTGVLADIVAIPIEDTQYAEDVENNKYEKYYYTSDFWKEVAWVPDTKKTCHTFFIEPDEVYLKAFDKYGISTENGNLRALYDLACMLYDPVYPKDVNAAGHAFDHLNDSVNPLRRFVQYHVVNRSIPGAADLTAPIMAKTNEAFGFRTELCNPIEWYQTLLPHTMIKVERLTRTQTAKRKATVDYMGQGIKNEHYLNRKYDENDQIEGIWVDPAVYPTHKGKNGYFFYIDDVLAFTTEVRDRVQNMRIRMDFSSIFPEVMSNDIRLKGDPFTDDDSGTPDDAAIPKNGRNYYFPEGYLDGVTFSNCHVVMRRPHVNFWSWQGDEWNLFGDYDFTFRIPPVPYSGEWQIRLGFCALKTRGVAQIYFDGIPQGIPLDMTQYLNEEAYLGSRFVNQDAAEWSSSYENMTDEAKAQEQKLLKNLGVYRAGRSTYHFNASGSKYCFTGNCRTYRRILCQTTIDANKDHYLRFRVASDGKQGNNNEFMLDYLELVPKSVYGVDGEGEMEDDL